MKIAIVGAYPGSKLGAPYGDSEWQIWSLSPRNENELPRCDVWFELHKPQMTNPDHPTPEYGKWLRSRPVVYMQGVVSDIPGSVEYPKDEMLARFGPHFFSSSFAWMWALAITKNPEAIGIWGVNPAAAEYAHQVPAHHHFAQVARAAGIEVIAPGCLLFDPCQLYGYEI
jgi:hypothetical protein